MSESRALPGVYPCLCYDNAVAAMEWLERVFGFRRRFAVIEDGKVLHSELSLGNAVIMLSSPKPEQQWVSASGLAGLAQALCVHVMDPAAHYEHAKAQGANIIQALKREDYGAAAIWPETQRASNGISAITCQESIGRFEQRSAGWLRVASCVFHSGLCDVILFLPRAVVAADRYAASR
ncbi:VOC family protein [Chromobacterium alticapitis]|uniref:VOC family protein n=1 Tax=Chromobacterium alticapitis TaxID=2073169 RepID=UPI0011B00725|nr:VOC family protein [Chromobacterium alticapitis]